MNNHGVQLEDDLCTPQPTVQIGQLRQKKANQPWTKINTLSGACIIFLISLCKSVIYIYISKSSLKCWVPPFLIARVYRKWTHLQMCWKAAIHFGVSGTCRCTAVEALKALSATGLLQTPCQLKRIVIKKEQRSLNDFIFFAACHGLPQTAVGIHAGGRDAGHLYHWTMVPITLCHSCSPA